MQHRSLWPDGFEPWLASSLLVFGVLLVGVVLGWCLQNTYRSRKTRRRTRRAFAQERAAKHLLIAHGYRVLDRQALEDWPVLIDGEALSIRLRVDYLVERDGRRYVADAKYGELVGSLRSPSTRRQLLEYLLAYEADAALVVDMRRRRILTIEFPALA